MTDAALSKPLSPAWTAPKGRARQGTRLIAAAAAVFVAALMLAPIAVSFLASIKTTAEASAVPPHYLPQTLSIENYQKIYFYQAGLWVYVGNSVAVAALAILQVILLTVPAGYGLARYNFRGKEFLFLLLLLPLMIPYQALLVPLYLMFAKIGLANTTIGLSIVHAMLQIPFSVYLMRNAFEGLPKELVEAATIDGAGSVQVLLRIALPLVLPAIITVSLFAFITSWNEFLAALIMMNKETSFTVPVMVTGVRIGQQSSVDWGALQAGVIVSMIPCILIYILLQKYYVSGLLNGAVK